MATRPRPNKKRPARSKSAPYTGGGTTKRGAKVARVDVNDMRTRRDYPDAVLAAVRESPNQQAVRLEGRMLLSDLMPDEPKWQGIRKALIDKGEYQVGTGSGQGNRVKVQLREVKDEEGVVVDHEVMAMGAISRDPGLTQDYIDSIQDFLPTATANRATQIQQLWKMYQSEPVLNNAVNKLSAVLSAGGRWKVRVAKKGKKQNALEELQAVLDNTARFINLPGVDQAITGNVGIKAVCQAAVRQCLVEGDFIGRVTWGSKAIEPYGTFNVPLNAQAITMAEIEAAKVFGTGLQLYYWVPSRDLIRELTDPTDKEVAKRLKKLLPSDVVSQLRKNNKYLLDQSLLLKVAHRGVDFRPFGESFLEPAKVGVAFHRAILAAEFVTMQNLINRLTIVMVGSADKTSPYGKADVSQARTTLMQQFFEESAPNVVIVWSGNDVDVKDVGAHQKALDTDGKHAIAQGMIKMGLGMPDALLLGTSDGGKSSGWASVIGAAAEMEELQNNFQTVLTVLGLRIAEQNGYTGVDLVWEFDKSLLVDRSDELNHTRSDYIAGGISIHSFLLARGKDPEAEFRTKAIEKGLDPDDETITWEEVFLPPQGLAGQGAPGDGPAAPPGQGPGKDPGAGRSPDSVRGGPKSKTPTEKKTTDENK